MAIRRNQVRPAPGYPGHATGMAAPTTGTADCFAVWSDNALLNTTRAFNDDTGLLWRIDFTNNVCLDVQQVFNQSNSHNTYRDPLTGPSGFTPFGELRRVQSVYENRSITNTTLVRSGFPPSYSYATNIAASNTKVLIGAYELVAGTPQYTSNNYTVSLRLRFHPTPTLQTNQSLVRQSTAHPTNVYVEVLSGGASSVGIRTNAIDANGVASFTITPSGSGVDRLRFWYDGVGHTHATAAEFDEYYDAWGTAEVPVGPMVSLVALPDVADDQWLQPGLLRFHRTSTNGTLQVNFTLPTYMAVEFNSSGVLVTNNRTAVRNIDYVLNNSTNHQAAASYLSGTNGSVTFGAGQSEIHVRVTPGSDFSTEGEVVAVKLESGTGYTVGPKGFATVYIWDGPEWRVYTLSATGTGFTSSKANAINGETNPRVAGQTAYNSGSSVYGVYWTTPSWTAPTTVSGLAEALGISTPSGGTPLTVVGYSGTSARKWVSGTGWSTLNHLESPGPSKATAISPNASYIVGYSRN